MESLNKQKNKLNTTAEFFYYGFSFTIEYLSSESQWLVFW